MIRFGKSNVHPIGLDIGHDSVKMIQLEQSGNALSVCAAARCALPEQGGDWPAESPDHAAVLERSCTRWRTACELIRSMKSREKFRGDRMTAALPRELLHIRHFRLPNSLTKPTGAEMEHQARQLLPIDPQSAQLLYISPGEVRSGSETRQEVILIAALKSDVKLFVDTFKEAGVILDGLDFEPCAMYRAVDRFVRRRDDENELHVLVDVGFDHSQVVIGKGKDIHFIRPIAVGGRNFVQAVSRKLGISFDEARALRRRFEDVSDDAWKSSAISDLVIPSAIDHDDPIRKAANDATRSAIEELSRQISMCLRYYAVTFRGEPPTQLRLIGGEASDPQLLSILNRCLSIPAELARPLLNVDTLRMKHSDKSAASSSWGLALGLALRFADGPFGPRDGKPRNRNTRVNEYPQIERVG